MQQSRRRDPHPFAWEIPLALTVAGALVLVWGVHLGRAAANLLAGAGWALPARSDLLTSLPDTLAGDATAGVTGLQGAGAGPSAVWAAVAVTELLLVTLMGWALKMWLERWGPARVKGVASVAEAEQLLGLSRLRRVAPIVRPDLHVAKRRRT